MRTLKLQMQTTADGFVAGPGGQLDWMNRELDEPLIAFINHLTDTSDTILLGRKMTPGFISYWEHLVAKPESPEHDFAKKMVGMPKVVFSKTIDRIAGQNVRVENRDVVEAVDELKHKPGRDIVVYGGATFVSSLIEHDLIDEFHFFVNPVAIGSGLQVFKSRKPLHLTSSVAHNSGVVVNSYRPKK
jgi:dihydrofolate reductase